MWSEPSSLQRAVQLSDLIEPDGFAEVMKSIADVHRVGVKVFDRGGRKLVDVRVGNGPFCGYLFEHGGSRQACTQLVEGLKKNPLERVAGRELPRVVGCFSGLRYVVVPLHHQGDLVGRLIFGPYLPEGQRGPAENLYRIEPRIERAHAETLLARVQQLPDSAVSRVLMHVQRVIEVLLFSGHRAWVTSQLHTESVTSSHRELQEKNHRLKEANDRLRDLDQMKSNFVATVSHELRTPLTSVIGYSEMLLEGIAGELGDEQREYVQTIREKGETLLSMISQILDLSRIESGSLQLRMAPFDVRDMLARAMTSVLPQARKKRISLESDIAEDAAIRAYRGDAEKIGQVIVNLLGNAVKFTPEGGRIRLGVERYAGKRRSPQNRVDRYGARALFEPDYEDFLRIRVDDSGIGIPDDQLERVFERFYQVDNSSARGFGGTGLGLSIVKNFVEGHGGDVWCERGAAGGTCFTVLLPLHEGAESAEG